MVILIKILTHDAKPNQLQTRKTHFCLRSCFVCFVNFDWFRKIISCPQLWTKSLSRVSNCFFFQFFQTVLYNWTNCSFYSGRFELLLHVKTQRLKWGFATHADQKKWEWSKITTCKKGRLKQTSQKLKWFDTWSKLLEFCDQLSIKPLFERG